MFENRARKKRRSILLLIIALIFVSAFGFGYYLNYGGDTDINKKTHEDPAGYKIPGTLRNPSAGLNGVNADTINETEKITNSYIENLITPNTKVIFRRYFTLCGHVFDNEPENMNEYVNLTEASLKSKFTDWNVIEFSPRQVILKKEIPTYCPRHYIIGSKDGYIAIYVYSIDGVKNLYEMTDYPISILTIEDQKKLEYGIVAESKEELQQKLEGLSD